MLSGLHHNNSATLFFPVLLIALIINLNHDTNAGPLEITGTRPAESDQGQHTETIDRENPDDDYDDKIYCVDEPFPVRCKYAGLLNGLKIKGHEATGYPFAGDWSTKGCYSYKSGDYSGYVWFGTGGDDDDKLNALNGDDKAAGKYRPSGYDCEDCKDVNSETDCQAGKAGTQCDYSPGWISCAKTCDACYNIE